MFITIDEIYEEFEELDARDQSQYLLELGYDLPRFPPEQRRKEDLVHGCQSQVWLTAGVDEGEDPVIHYRADSDAEIVRGLITILLAVYEGKTASEILQFRITEVFDRLHLKQYISPQRHNGLQGMVDRIRDIAAQHARLDQRHTDANPDVTNGTPKPGARAPRKPFDVEDIRSQFPVLMQTLPDGRHPCYLDSGASAQKPTCVIEKEREVEEQYFANAYRGRYSFGARIDDELEASRATIASFINAPTPQQIAFTPGATATLNMIAFGWGRPHVSSNDEIVITELEHHANFVPWQQLAKQTGAKLRFIPLTDDGQIDLSRLDEVINERTKIVAVTGMSNVLGSITPVREITKKAHDVGAIVVVDGAQSVPHMATDVITDDVDFLVFSGHKVYGPTGVGILYGKADRLKEMEPLLFGGHMINRVYKDHSTWAPAPAKFEAGTLPIVQAIALGTAIEWMDGYGMEAINQHEHRLLVKATDALERFDGLKIFGPSVDHKGGIISFRMEGVHPEDLAAILDQHGIATRHGHHCTMPLHDLLQVSATTRVSFAAYNTEDDVDRLIGAIDDARRKLSRR